MFICSTENLSHRRPAAGPARLLGSQETAQVRRLLSRQHPAARLALLADRLRPRASRWTGIAVTI